MQGTAATEQCSPWFPRSIDYGFFTLEVTAVGGGGTPTLTVEMYHKNASDTGDGALAAGNMSFARTTTGRTTVDFANAAGSSPAFGGFEELVRYKFRISGGASSVTTWATFRMLAPIWYDKV